MELKNSRASFCALCSFLYREPPISSQSGASFFRQRKCNSCKRDPFWQIKLFLPISKTRLGMEGEGEKNHSLLLNCLTADRKEEARTNWWESREGGRGGKNHLFKKTGELLSPRSPPPLPLLGTKQLLLAPTTTNQWVGERNVNGRGCAKTNHRLSLSPTRRQSPSWPCSSYCLQKKKKKKEQLGESLFWFVL